MSVKTPNKPMPVLEPAHPSSPKEPAGTEQKNRASYERLKSAGGNGGAVW